MMVIGGKSFWSCMILVTSMKSEQFARMLSRTTIDSLKNRSRSGLLCTVVVNSQRDEPLLKVNSCESGSILVKDVLFRRKSFAL